MSLRFAPAAFVKSQCLSRHQFGGGGMPRYVCPSRISGSRCLMLCSSRPRLAAADPSRASAAGAADVSNAPQPSPADKARALYAKYWPNVSSRTLQTPEMIYNSVTATVLAGAALTALVWYCFSASYRRVARLCDNAEASCRSELNRVEAEVAALGADYHQSVAARDQDLSRELEKNRSLTQAVDNLTSLLKSCDRPTAAGGGANGGGPR